MSGDKQRRQYDPTKMPLFDGERTSLDIWEQSAMLYLQQFNDAEWCLIRSPQQRQQMIQHGHWTADHIRDDQHKAYELLWHTFVEYKQSIVVACNKNRPQYASELWQAIYEDYRGDRMVEANRYLSEMIRAKIFHGEFANYIDKINDLRVSNICHIFFKCNSFNKNLCILWRLTFLDKHLYQTFRNKCRHPIIDSSTTKDYLRINPQLLRLMQ